MGFQAMASLDQLKAFKALVQAIVPQAASHSPSKFVKKDGRDPFYGALSYGSMPKSAHPLRESPDRQVYRIVAQP